MKAKLIELAGQIIIYIYMKEEEEEIKGERKNSETISNTLLRSNL